MTKLEDIERAIAQLSAEELAKLRAWFEDFDGRVFDEKDRARRKVRQAGQAGG